MNLGLMLATFHDQVGEVFRVEAARVKVRGGADVFIECVTDLASPSLREVLTEAIDAQGSENGKKDRKA